MQESEVKRSLVSVATSPNCGQLLHTDSVTFQSTAFGVCPLPKPDVCLIAQYVRQYWPYPHTVTVERLERAIQTAYTNHPTSEVVCIVCVPALHDIIKMAGNF